MNQESKEPNMKNNEQKERDIRACMKKDLDYKTAIISVIASCMSSNVGGEEERLLEINIVLRMIETIRLTDLAKYVATHIEGVDGDAVFDMWWQKAQSCTQKDSE